VAVEMQPAPWNKGKKLRPISARARADFLKGLADGLTVRLAAEKAGRGHPRRFYELRGEDTRRSPRRGLKHTSRERRCSRTSFAAER
jgi:hypothetical protein